MQWTEIYASRQNRSILTSTVTGVEEITVNGEKIPCLIVGENIKGIIPVTESGIEPGPGPAATRSRLMNLLCQEISFIVIGIDRENEIFTASRAEALKKQSAQTWQTIKPGQVRTAIARRYCRTTDQTTGRQHNLGIFVEIDGIETLLPVSEISHGWVEDLSIIPLGEKIPVKVLSADPENKKISVSHKAVLPDPWPGCLKKYHKGGIYTGTVSGVVEYGVFVALEPGVNCLCKHPRAGKLDRGDAVAVAINSISPEERRINGAVVRILRKSVLSAV